jgi:hypothetical protein
MFRKSRDSSIGIGRGMIAGRKKIFLVSAASRTALGTTKPPIQWATGALITTRVVKLITHLFLVHRSRMVELYLHALIRLPGVMLD